LRPVLPFTTCTNQILLKYIAFMKKSGILYMPNQLNIMKIRAIFSFYRVLLLFLVKNINMM